MCLRYINCWWVLEGDAIRLVRNATWLYLQHSPNNQLWTHMPVQPVLDHCQFIPGLTTHTEHTLLASLPCMLNTTHIKPSYSLLMRGGWSIRNPKNPWQREKSLQPSLILSLFLQKSQRKTQKREEREAANTRFPWHL